MRSILNVSLLAASAAGIILSTPAVANAQASAPYDLPAQGLAATLRRIGEIGGIEILFTPSDVEGITAPAVQGDLTVPQAIDRVLSGTALDATYAERAVIIKRRATPAPAHRETIESGNDIVVTGSRIRGGPVASPVITLSAANIRDAGQTSLGDVARSIPQSFGGGQNPGIGVTVPSTAGVNVGGASTLNLRGLGSDATLTLLNGHRLTYNGSRQGIDISSIPLGAVARLEIVADGSSALYGSDAVAGVANIILRRDFSGLEVSARHGISGQGDFAQSQYGAVAGTRWRSGGLFAAYEYADNARLLSDDRTFTASRPGVTIYPYQRRHAVAAAGHQALSDALTFEFDALYNKRWNDSGFPLNTVGNLAVSRSERDATSQSWEVTPALKLALPHGWLTSLTGTYGEETVFTRIEQFAGTTRTSNTFICYCNSGKSVELATDGPLFRLPAGAIKVAAGAGYRTNLLDAFQGAGNPQNITRSQDSRYVYGELSVPLAAPAQDMRFLQRLNLSAAVRYERYPGIASVATPKFGLIYAPSADLDFKASWGRSFRAPTLFQQYNAPAAILYPVAALGGQGYPAGSTALLVAGGNAILRPERAATWNATLDLHPRALDGARLQLSYFSTGYTDRIVTPIAFTAQALSSTAYASLITRSPSAATTAAAIAAAIFANATGAPLNPASVVAIVDNRSVNAGRQRIHGVDLLGDYTLDLRAGQRLAMTFNASYLVSDQRLFAGQPTTQLAGVLFNPPHWRGRGSLTWSDDPLTLNATLSYIGGIDDTRFTPTTRVEAMTTLDLTARYALKRALRIPHGLDLTLSLQNLLDATPTRIVSTSFQDTTYDSTNYAPIGRAFSFGVTAAW